MSPDERRSISDAIATGCLALHKKEVSLMNCHDISGAMIEGLAQQVDELIACSPSAGSWNWYILPRSSLANVHSSPIVARPIHEVLHS
ncbi:MAG TPA: hypothetical protein VHL08_02755 [Dongiaceae bacterium]|jgi:hypothetical protein|nr:hypothetical protein [Dongiaceae bacterium]